MEKLFNSEILKLLRKSKSLSQKEICEQLGQSQANYSKIEHGILPPSEIFIEQVSSFFQVVPSFFFQDERTYSPLNPYHRSRSTLQIGDRDRVEAIANIYRIHLKKLLEVVEIPFNLLPIQVSENNTPEAIARLTRRNLRLPNGPINNVTKILEDNGIFIISFDFETELLDGFTIHGNDNVLPLIFFNATFPGERIRFTAAHELGHLVMHQQLETEDNREIEKEANLFAAEFLMPQHDILQELRFMNTNKLSLEFLLRLKMKWKVSMSALLKRIEDLNIITKNQAQYLWMQISSKGYRKAEPYPIPIESPSLLNELLNIYKNDLQYSEQDMAALLKITPDAYFDYFEKNKTRFKLVK